MADGQATKIFLPADTSSVMGSIAGIAELFREAGPDRPVGGAPGPDQGA